MTACKLNRANVDFDARRIHGETKGGSKYDVPMTQRLHDRLLWYCAAAQDADEPLTSVFRPHRKPFTSPALHTAMTDARKRAGVTSHWGLHDLRRTAARNLYEHTKDLRKTQALLGHRTLWTTVWYLGNAATTLTAEDLEASTTNTNPKTERKHA
jgi:site-specific recombinase XerC